MFAWRKRNQGDEEESLVPHGMIWHATEDEKPLASTECSQSGAPEKAKVVEMPPPQSDPKREPSPGNNREVKLGAISPPLRWPSPRIQEIAKWARPHVRREAAVAETAPLPEPVTEPAAIPPYVEPAPALIVQQNVSSPVQESTSKESESKESRRQELLASPVEQETLSLLVATPPSEPEVPRAPFGERLRVRMRGHSEVLRQEFSIIFARVRSALLDTVAALKELETRAQNFYRALEMRRQVRRAEQIAARSSEAQPAVEAEPPDTALDSIETQIAANVEKTNDQLKHAAAWLREQSIRSTETLRRAWSFKVRVRIHVPELSGIRAGFARATSPPDSDLNPRPDSRLRTSMAMAALSALLALAVITGVRRYDAEPGPSNVSASSPAATSPQPAAILPQKPSAANSKTSAHGVDHAATTAAVKQASLSSQQAQPTTPKTATRKQRRHGPDEDYVAKDTYVYYGPAGKPSR